MSEICESDVDIEEDEISVETAYINVEESLELFDCPPLLKNVKSDRILQLLKGRSAVSQIPLPK